jgi:peroxiredoxin
MVEVKRRSPDVGEAAPEFALQDSEFMEVKLGDYRGKTVILAFFPAAFSGVCTMELCTFRDQVAELHELDAFLLGISVDLPYSLREFRKKGQIDFPLLSDFDRQVMNAYGVVDETFHGYHTGVAQRSVFVVDPSGNIAWRWISEKQSESPDIGDVFAAVEGLKTDN